LQEAHWFEPTPEVLAACITFADAVNPFIPRRPVVYDDSFIPPEIEAKIRAAQAAAGTPLTESYDYNRAEGTRAHVKDAA
jgi:hypothetical protein